MTNSEAFEAWYQKAYACFGQANFQLNSYGEYVDDDIEASWCAWQAALASQQQDHIPNVGQMVQSQAQQEPAKAKHHPICDGRHPSLCDACNAEAKEESQARHDTLNDFQEGQWWLKELDALVLNGTDDQKRAVAVVRNLMRLAQTQQEPAKATNLFEIVTHGESGDAWLLLRADVNLGLGHHCIKFEGAAADDLRKRFKVMGSMRSQAQQKLLKVSENWIEPLSADAMQRLKNLGVLDKSPSPEGGDK